MTFELDDWIRRLVAPAVLISLVGGASTAGYVVGRNELSERVATIEARIDSHHMTPDAHHRAVSRSEVVTRAEYEADKARIFESLGEIKALLAELRRQK